MGPSPPAPPSSLLVPAADASRGHTAAAPQDCVCAVFKDEVGSGWSFLSGGGDTASDSGGMVCVWDELGCKANHGSLKPSQVFDTDQLAKVMALRALIGSSEFDWMDTKFYYNL